MAIPQDAVAPIRQEIESFRVRDSKKAGYQNEWLQQAYWTEPALRILEEPDVVILAGMRNFIIEATGNNPIIISINRGPNATTNT